MSQKYKTKNGGFSFAHYSLYYPQFMPTASTTRKYQCHLIFLKRLQFMVIVMAGFSMMLQVNVSLTRYY